MWDDPRPPAIFADKRLVVVRASETVIASTRRSCRVLETTSPSTFYLPREDVDIWSHETPTPGFAVIARWLAFYPSKLDCRVDGERARAQAGGFYVGWITREIVGPFKGEPETSGR